MAGFAVHWIRLAGRGLAAAAALLWGSAQAQTAETLQVPAGAQNPLAFEVQRNGVPVGTHCVAFTRENSRLRVDVMMELQVPVALWFDYRYRYKATEWWQSGRLDALRVQIQDGRNPVRIHGQTRDGRLEVDGPRGLLRLTSDLLPSNHWNVAILQESAVLNTLTGTTSELEVSREGSDSLVVAGAEIDADRFRLGGDLSDTRVWYDRQGRWRGLEFSARDGSVVRLHPRDIANVLTEPSTDSPWNRNSVCKSLSGALSG